MQTTHWVAAVFVDELMYCNVIRMELWTGVIPTDYVLTSWTEGGKRGRERERERERESVYTDTLSRDVVYAYS